MMPAQFSPISSVGRSTLRSIQICSIQRWFTGAAFALVGLAVASVATPATEVLNPSHNLSNTSSAVYPAIALNNQRSLADGTYLYGQSPKANTLGSAYMLVQMNKQQVVGAFYMPASSFDCFRGEVQGEQLALTIVDSYERTSHPYSVALQTTTTVATTGNPAAVSVVPEGFYPIATISENDRKILATCQAND